VPAFFATNRSFFGSEGRARYLLPLVEVLLIGLSLDQAKPKGSSFADFVKKLRAE
jgi:hypothetical protein